MCTLNVHTVELFTWTGRHLWLFLIKDFEFCAVDKRVHVNHPRLLSQV